MSKDVVFSVCYIICFLVVALFATYYIKSCAREHLNERLVFLRGNEYYDFQRCRVNINDNSFYLDAHIKKEYLHKIYDSKGNILYCGEKDINYMDAFVLQKIKKIIKEHIRRERIE